MRPSTGCMRNLKVHSTAPVLPAPDARWEGEGRAFERQPDHDFFGERGPGNSTHLDGVVSQVEGLDVVREGSGSVGSRTPSWY